MTDASHQYLREEAYKEVTRHSGKALLLSLLVLSTHIFKLQPTSVEFGPLKIAIEDIIVIQGAIALLFLFYLWSSIGGMAMAQFTMPNPKRMLTRPMLRYAQKPYRPPLSKRHILRTPSQAKRWVRWALIIQDAYLAPMVVIILFVTALAGLLAVEDSWKFLKYIWARDWDF
jgi:hypothetical protein